MGKVLNLAEKLWNGETNTYLNHPFAEPYEIEEIAEGLWFNRAFSNSIIRKTSEGLIIIDPAAQFDEAIRHKKVRSVTKDRVHTVIYTHGHVDHCFGLPQYYRECKRNQWKKPHIISHENVPKRFDRYEETHGYNAYINQRQFLGGQGQPYFPKGFIYPTIIFSDTYTLEIGGITVELYHDKGETDDAIWAYLPQDDAICTGDLFIWGVPNGGNPQKAPRYIKEWSNALIRMREKHASILLPGHGVPIIGKERVEEALMTTAEFLKTLCTQTIDLMNRGCSLPDIIQKVTIPEELMKKPYLQPIYDEPEFLIRNVWRLKGGQYDGIPSHLKPAKEIDLAREIAGLAGSPEQLAERALVLSQEDKPRLACHLIEWALRCEPENEKMKRIYTQIFRKRIIETETSTMAMGIYLSAIRDIGEDPGEDLAGNTPIFVQKKIAESKYKTK
jgi:alkyl sulfatase BDS1-like metallo-beta-lactamase superfamily hydrolase